MAEGAWVPAFDSIWTSPKTARLAKELKTSNDVAAAKFLRLMSWMRDHFPTGDLGPTDRATMARAIGLATENARDEVAGQRGQTFYEALVGARFLSSDERGHVRGWEEGPGRLVERRASDRLRKDHKKLGTHDPMIADCPTCREAMKAQTPMTTASPAARSAGTPQERQRKPDPVPQEFLRTGRTEQGEQREQGAPSPRPVGRTEQAAPSLETVGERQARELLEGATGRWRDALQALLIAGMTSANLCTWFVGTTLEERAGFAVVRAPNPFAVEWLTKKYRPQIAHVLSLPTTRVVIALEGQAVELEPEPVDEESA